MFSTCLSVCLSVRQKKLLTDFDEIVWRGVAWLKQRLDSGSNLDPGIFVKDILYSRLYCKFYSLVGTTSFGSVVLSKFCLFYIYSNNVYFSLSDVAILVK